MKINSSQIKYLSKITNSLYEELKIEFLYHSNHLEGSTFSKQELDKLLTEKQVLGIHMVDDIIETKNKNWINQFLPFAIPRTTSKLNYF